MSNKHDLRPELLARRKAMSVDTCASMNQKICESVLAWCGAESPRVLALYMPMRGEPNPLATCAGLAALGIQLALPVVVQRDAPLAFAAWTPGAEMARDLGRVPVPTAPQRLVDPDTVLIPCVGYNADGYRLGYGGGYYDRTLAQRPGVRAIGIAWSDSLVEFSADWCDVPMEAIITEVGLSRRHSNDA